MHAARGVGQSGSVDRRRRPRRHKTALVLGGGGFTGGVYEIGALRALDLLAVNSSVNQFDVYVGTSAGAFIAALSANGVTPEEMMRVVTRQGKAPFKDIDLSDLLRPNLLEFARKGAVLPWRAVWAGAPGHRPARRRVADGRAAGLRRGAALRRIHRRRDRDLPARGALRAGRTDNFGDLACELYLTATDLDTCERVVFGVDGAEDVPISTAVRASGALPMVYAPVRVERSRADRRRHGLDHEPGHRRRGGRKADRRDQPDRALRQRFRRAGAHASRDAPAARLGHGLPADRLPGLQARRPPASARTGQELGATATPAWTSC